MKAPTINDATATRPMTRMSAGNNDTLLPILAMRVDKKRVISPPLEICLRAMLWL